VTEKRRGELLAKRLEAAYEKYDKQRRENRAAGKPAGSPWYRQDGKLYNLMGDMEDGIEPTIVRGPYPAKKDSIYFMGRAGPLTPHILAQYKGDPEELIAKEPQEGDELNTAYSKKAQIKNKDVLPTVEHPDIYRHPWAQNMWATQHPHLAMQFTQALYDRAASNDIAIDQNNPAVLRDRLYQAIYAFKVMEPEAVEEVHRATLDLMNPKNTMRVDPKVRKSLEKKGKKALHGQFYSEHTTHRKEPEEGAGIYHEWEDASGEIHGSELYPSTEELMIFDRSLPIEVLFIMIAPLTGFTKRQQKFLEEIGTGDIAEYGEGGDVSWNPNVRELNVLDPLQMYNSKRLTPKQLAELRAKWFEGVPPEGMKERERQFKEHDLARFIVKPTDKRTINPDTGRHMTKTDSYIDLPHGVRHGTKKDK